MLVQTLAETFWLVWQPLGGSPNNKHKTIEAAVAEAERLSQRPRNQGRRFYVLECKGSVMTGEEIAPTSTRQKQDLLKARARDVHKGIIVVGAAEL